MLRFDLRSLRFDEAGEAWRQLPVEVAPFFFGGLEYEVADGVVDLDLTAGRVGENVTLVAGFETTVTGPCQRCLGQADIEIKGRGIEYVRHGESEVDPDDDGEEGYVTSNVLDLERWVRDMIADELPDKLLCSDECRGLCPECGADLNIDGDHRHEPA